jgi:hypothetical protein
MSRFCKAFPDRPARSVRAVKAILDASVLLGPAPEEIEGELAISSATLAELHFGVLVARTEEVRAERLHRLGAVERSFDARLYTRNAEDFGGLTGIVEVIALS